MSVINPGAAKAEGPADLTKVLAFAKVLAESGLFEDARTVARAAAKILAGQEFGFPPFASMVGIYVIDGKPYVGAHLLAAAIKRSQRYDFHVLRCDREACEIEFRKCATDADQPWQVLGKISLTIQEAKEAGLLISEKTGREKRAWRLNPDDMLFARCIAKGYRRFCPDLNSGILIYDSESIDEGGVSETDMEREPLAAPPGGSDPNAHAPAPVAPAATQDSWLQLLQEHGRTEEDLKDYLRVLDLKTLQEVLKASCPEKTRSRLRQYIIQGLLSIQRRDQIFQLIEKLQLPLDKVMTRLKEQFGISSLAQLTEAEANLVEAALVKRLHETTAPATS